MEKYKVLILIHLLSTAMWATAMHNKGPLCNLQTTQADLGLCCPLTESVNIVVYVNKQKMPRLDCTDGYGDLDLCFPHKCPFRALHIILYGMVGYYR